MEAMFGHLDLLIFLYDLLGYARNNADLIQTFCAVFTVCAEKGLKLTQSSANW